MKKSIAEAIGTFILVFIGTGAAVLSGATVGTIGIGLAFGLAIWIAAFTVGSVSGAHLNPAVSLGMLVNKRINVTEFCYYIVGQIIGAILASGALKLVLSNANLPVDNLAQTTFGELSAMGAFFIEGLLTFLLVLVVMSVTSKKIGTPNGGMVIGLTLTALHFIGVPLTGMSVNPVRSLAPAMFVGGEALSQLWVYLLAPLVGGILAALVAKYFLETEEV